MVNLTFSLLTFEYFLLVLVRISTFVFIAPFFSTTNTPAQVRIGLSLFVSILVFSFVDTASVQYTGTIEFAILVLREGITGLLIGFAANICNSIILFAGNMIDTNIGLAMAQEFDPITQTQVTLSANLYNYILLLLLMVSGMHRYILRALVDSFQVVPLAGAVFDFAGLLQAMLSFVTQLFVIAFRIILPVWSCIMIMNCVLGVMAKVAPQMNMFAVGIQLKLIVGLVIMLLTVMLLPYVADFIFREMKVMIVAFIESMY